MNFMGDNMKNVDKTCYLQHHGTAPFWWFSWEILQKMGYRMLFVASWYRAVFVKSMENIMRVIDNMTYL